MPPLISDFNNEKTEGLEYFDIFYDAASDLQSQDEIESSNVHENDRKRTIELRDISIPLGALEPSSVTESNSQSQYFTREITEPADLEAKPDVSSRSGSHIRQSDWVYPISKYEGYVSPLPISKERDVITEFLNDISQRDISSGKGPSLDSERFTEFELSDFSIYLPDSIAHHKGEMRGLQNLATQSANSRYCFDGILSSGNLRRYVQKVHFQTCSIGGYGDECDSVSDDIWIQSSTNHKTDVFYRLKEPSPQYARYHQSFMWLANLAKYFVDYARSVTERKEKLSIHNFRSDFASWLKKLHGMSPIFRVWFDEHDHTDFRRAIAGNIEFLWKEYIGTNPKYVQHPLWNQVKDMNFIPEQRMQEKMTIVTPYVYDCFNHIRFSHHLKKVVPVGKVDSRRKSLGQAFNSTADYSLEDDGENSPENFDLAVSKLRSEIMSKILERKFDRTAIAVGDVLGVTKDKETTWKDEVSKWKDEDECWWVLVQGIRKSKNGKRTFNVIWLYRPSDTTCAKMRYPYHNELFLSDNCNCGDVWIDEAEILCTASVMWHGQHGDSEFDFFIRQTYLHDNSFVTLNERHKQCGHLGDDLKSHFNEILEKYHVGDTVLVVPPKNLKSKHCLEACEIVAFVPRDDLGLHGFISVRLLRRRRDLVKTTISKPNELVYTEEIFTVRAKSMVRKCLVRFYSEDEVMERKIPAPYNRDGTGNAFYITSRLVGLPRSDGEGNMFQPIEENLPQSLIQGFDPKGPDPRERLRGLDLYCGGGNFGRGLEEGGAIRVTHAVDLAGNAIHTHYANQTEPDSTKYFYGSVDDVLFQALHDNPSRSDLIPLPGMIDFLSAGSPCQGYSLLNGQRDNEQGLKNQSLVASVAAYVDFYRPKYALLENVISMAAKGRGRDEDVLAQLMCCVVGMGYQVQLFLIDAWSCGSPQSRSRLFVSMAAPGLKLPEHPGLSHSHPNGTSNRGLGQGANGLSFGERQFELTPFKFITSSEATGDLPDIGDGSTAHCTRHPDHKMPILMSQRMKYRIEAIPRYPRQMNFVKTWHAKLLSKTELELFPLISKEGKLKQSAGKDSKAWERIHPQKLFSTIATSLCPADARTGRALHWDQHRLMTLMEARRAQSFPDEEVLTGISTKQWKIVGNSVARTVALALGLVVRDAWLSNPLDDNYNSTHDLTVQLCSNERSALGGFEKISPLKGEKTTVIPLREHFGMQPMERLRRDTDDLTEGSSDDIAQSDTYYRWSLKHPIARSSISRDELTTSANSTPWSEHTDMERKKRSRDDYAKSREHVPEQVLAMNVSKRVKLLGPTRLRDSKCPQPQSAQPTQNGQKSKGEYKAGQVKSYHGKHESSSTFIEPTSLQKALEVVRAE